MEPMTDDEMTSEQIYDKLLESRDDAEFRRSLKAFKDACDLIEQKIKGSMSYSAIAGIAKRNAQTIKNDIDGHRKYVKKRQEEYEKKRDSLNALKAVSYGVAVPKPRYPASDLDIKTKCFVDDLWREIEAVKSRNVFLENTISEVRKEVLQKTLEEPLSARKMLQNGPLGEGSMSLVLAGSDAWMVPLTPDLRKALESVLNLHCHHSSLYLDRGHLMLKALSENMVIMYAKELKAVASVLGKDVLDGE